MQLKLFHLPKSKGHIYIKATLAKHVFLEQSGKPTKYCVIKKKISCRTFLQKQCPRLSASASVLHCAAHLEVSSSLKFLTTLLRPQYTFTGGEGGWWGRERAGKELKREISVLSQHFVDIQRLRGRPCPRCYNPFHTLEAAPSLHALLKLQPYCN